MTKTAREVIAEIVNTRAVYSGFHDAIAANLEFADDSISALNDAGFIIVPKDDVAAMREALRNIVANARLQADATFQTDHAYRVATHSCP